MRQLLASTLKQKDVSLVEQLKLLTLKTKRDASKLIIEGFARLILHSTIFKH
jgi:hypothetical protein